MVECKICGRKYKKITASHLQKHNISYDDYLKEYEPEKYFIKRVAEILDRLYITFRYKWDILNHKGNYKHCKKGKKRKWGLSLSDIKDHLKGKKTIAVYQLKNKSKFIGFDIDIKDIQVVEKVYQALRSYDILDKAIIISFSGNKGYHIDIFLSDMLDYQEIRKFYKLVRIDTDLSKNQVELAGGNNSYKLPLGLNFKVRHSKGEGYCYLCNEHGLKLNDSQVLNKLENIKPVKPELIKDVVDINEITILTEQEKLEFQEIVDGINLLDSYQNPLEALINSIEGKGITEAGTRHNKAFVLALGYREQGYCSRDIYQKLIKWHKTLDPQYYKTSLEDCKKEYKRISKDVFRERYKLPIHDIKKEGFITKNIIEKVLSVKKKGKGTKPLRKLLFTMIIHSLMYANKNDIFYMTYKQINQALNTNNPRGTLKNQIDDLVNQGHIEIIQRGERGKGLKYNPNKYRVKDLPKVNKDNTFKICNKTDKCKDCLYKATCHFYSDKEIKEKFSYRKAKEIINTEPCLVNC